METVRFSVDHLRLACRSANRPFHRLVVRVGRFNGLFVWMTADECFRRTLHRNLMVKSNH